MVTGADSISGTTAMRLQRGRDANGGRCVIGHAVDPAMIVVFVVLASLILDVTDHQAAFFVVVAADVATECGLWMGPSQIKDLEAHGYGLGMYTGRLIKKGTQMSREVAIPVFDYDEETFDDTPLREYVWPGEAYKPLVLESDQGMALFLPGLAGIAPCTSNNYNLELIHPRDEHLMFDLDDSVEDAESNKSDINNAAYDVQRMRDPTAGAFSRMHARNFRAIRDIQPGEELVVECSDDDFDGSTHSLNKYDPNNEKIFCLDNKVELRPSSSKPKIGDGVFAKRLLSENEIVLSSPAVPIHRSVLDMNHFRPPGKQLVINYCYGHPDSDLLWLPYGPIFNGINHADNIQQANVKVQWHHDSTDTGHYNQKDIAELSGRKQYHHPELLMFSPERVANTHGKGLVIDVVATRPIGPNDELFLDYGQAWRDAWSEHVAKIEAFPMSSKDEEYVPAMLYNKQHVNDTIRTITEQRHDPYPWNLITACRFERDWIDDENAKNYEMIQYHSWHEQTEHRSCLLPCMILERIEGDSDGHEDSGQSPKVTYSAKLIDKQHDNINIEWECHIFKRFEYIYTDIPRESIEFVEKVYRSDIFMVGAFRHPIQVPDGMYPDHWLKSNTTTTSKRTSTISPKSILRGSRSSDSSVDDSTKTAPIPQNATRAEKQVEESFKRKKRSEPLFDREEMMRKKMEPSSKEEL
jgi:hypothetical protein